MRALVVSLSLLIASTSLAQPREGANHHLGDDSFVATFGRSPDPGDSEKLRMRTHLTYVRDLLAARAPTAPELAPRRAELLGYLDDYVALGVTPVNTYVPWRSPVFIDADGAICAVGYLIERSVGRALPEAIARTHRTLFLEDIAAAEPEVRAWIAGSGFTLTELASIQPAYSEPAVDTWRTWGGSMELPADGVYAGVAGSGAFRKGRMEGAWKVMATDADSGVSTVVGRGDLARGAGTWTSFHPDGTKRAIGPYAGNRAHGSWTLFHPSGNVAAEGRFERGVRTGKWRFFADAPVKTPIAIGTFDAHGAVTGTWRHYDRGILVATSWTETPAQWADHDLEVDGGEGFMLAIEPAANGVNERSHQGTVFGRTTELRLLARGREQIFVHEGFGITTMYDADGNRLVRDGTTWRASRCHWASKRKQIARAGDLARLHGLLFQDLRRRVGTIQQHDAGDDPGPTCDQPTVIAAARGAVIDGLLAAAERPEGDRIRVLDDSMGTYLEWPHIDGLFTELFETIPGRFSWDWPSGDPRDYGEPDQPRPRR